VGGRQIFRPYLFRGFSSFSASFQFVVCVPRIPANAFLDVARGIRLPYVKFRDFELSPMGVLSQCALSSTFSMRVEALEGTVTPAREWFKRVFGKDLDSKITFQIFCNP
jgi:hypothetical protein